MDEQILVALTVLILALVVHAIVLGCQRHADRERALNAPPLTEEQAREVLKLIQARLEVNGLDKLRVRRPLFKITPEEWTVPNIELVRNEIADAIEKHATAKRDHPEGYARAKRAAEVAQQLAPFVPEG